jgi:hypothetical protein
MMFTSRAKPAFTEELVVVWRPHRLAPSLLGEGYHGSSLGGIHHEPRGMRSEKAYHHPHTMAIARRESA